jgi:hypothetical protein
MNIMLLIVCVASFAIAQVATGVVVLGLVTFDVVMGSSQELKARASVEALEQLQVPRARVRRSGQDPEVIDRLPELHVLSTLSSRRVRARGARSSDSPLALAD